MLKSPSFRMASRAQAGASLSPSVGFMTWKPLISCPLKSRKKSLVGPRLTQPACPPSPLPPISRMSSCARAEPATTAPPSEMRFRVVRLRTPSTMGWLACTSWPSVRAKPRCASGCEPCMAWTVRNATGSPLTATRPPVRSTLHRLLKRSTPRCRKRSQDALVEKRGAGRVACPSFCLSFLPGIDLGP